MKNERIGILGGTFDPPHYGHLNMARAAMDELKPDRILFIPTGTPAYKLNRQQISDAADRLAMLKLLIRDIPWAEISTIDCDRPGNTYTADTLRELTLAHPENKYFFILGSDSLRDMKNWHKPAEIFRMAEIVVILRDEDFAENLQKTVSDYKECFQASIRFLTVPKSPFSSTEIRRLVKAGRIPKDAFPEEIAEYIRIHDLYRTPTTGE